MKTAGPISARMLSNSVIVFAFRHAIFTPGPSDALAQYRQLCRVGREGYRYPARASALLLGRDGRHRHAVAVRSSSAVHARRAVGLGTVHALPGGVAVRLDWSAVRGLGFRVAALPQGAVAG